MGSNENLILLRVFIPGIFKANSKLKTENNREIDTESQWKVFSKD